MDFKYCRLEVDNLEKTSIESEVYDFAIDGEDDAEPEEEPGQPDIATDRVDHEVEIIPPADVVGTDYFITSSKNMDLPHRLHGPVSKRIGCGQQLEYKKTYADLKSPGFTGRLPVFSKISRSAYIFSRQIS